MSYGYLKGGKGHEAGKYAPAYTKPGEPGIIQGPGVTEADDYVLFLGDADTDGVNLNLIAREGDPAPEAGPGVYFETFGGCQINNRTEAF